MSIEQIGPNEKDIEPIRDAEISPILLSSKETKLSPFRELKESFGLNRRAENIVSPEQEDPEFVEWLRSISLNPDQLPFDPQKIPDPDLAKEIQRILVWHKDHAKDIFERAEQETDMREKEISISVGNDDLRTGWIDAVYEYINARGDDVYYGLVARMKERGELSDSERVGLSCVLTRGLARQLMQWRNSGDFYEDSQRRGFNQWPKEELKDIFDEIRSRIPKKPQPTEWVKDKEAMGQDAIPDYRHRSSLFAILTYERSGGPEDLLVFAMKKLEIMGLYSNGGMDIQLDSNHENIPKAVHEEYVIAGDCIIMAARIAKLLGDEVKQHELYERAYNFFGNMGKSGTRLEGLTPMTSYFAKNTFDILIRRIAECAQGADLPEAEFLKKTYEKTTGKISKNNPTAGTNNKSLPEIENRKALP